MKELTDFLTTHQWVLEVFGLVLGTGLVHLLARVLMARLNRQFEKTRNLYDDAVLEAVRRPLGFAIWVVGIGWAAELVGGNAPAGIFEYVDDIRQVAIIWLLVWFAVRFIRFVEEHVADASYRDHPVDRTTAAAVGKLLRASVIITGVLMVLQNLGFSISGVLAFGGIGGIAVGFAARDTLANFFGALMIFLDRPFSVGDWIRSPDQEIEGTVEEIGWRLTRIRTFDQRPLYVPNSVFSTIAVENPSRMLNRRIYETVGVRYDDVAALPQIVADVEAMLKNHADIDQSRTLMVNFNKFGASSLDFFVYTFTRTTVWTEFHTIKQDVLFRIAQIVAGHGAEIAFPTQTLHLAEQAVQPAAPEQALTALLADIPGAPAAVLAARRRAEVLVDAAAVQHAIDRVSVRLSLEVCNDNPLMLVVMNGGLPYGAELLKRLSFPLQLGYVHVARYGTATRGGKLSWLNQPDYELTGRTVILLDDVFDRGETLAAIVAWAADSGAGRVLTSVLVDKQVTDPRPLRIDYPALSCPDRYLFGCGMDFQGYWRNLPAIYALPEELESA